MKTRILLSMAALTLLVTVANAGLSLPFPVTVDLASMTARGDQNTARTAADDLSYIGCGIRVTDDGVNPPFAFGFCQAGNSAGIEVVCFTENPSLLNAMGAHNDFSFIRFNWQDDGFGGSQCTHVGFSTQSFYLPDFKTNDSDSDSDSD